MHFGFASSRENSDSGTPTRPYLESVLVVIEVKVIVIIDYRNVGVFYHTKSMRALPILVTASTFPPLSVTQVFGDVYYYHNLTSTVGQNSRNIVCIFQTLHTNSSVRTLLKDDAMLWWVVTFKEY